MIAKIDPGQLDGELTKLAVLSLDQLKARWLHLKGFPLPKFLRRGLMTMAVSHALREAALGGLDVATQKRLDILVAQIVPTGQRPPPKPNRIKPGTRTGPRMAGQGA